MTAPDMIAGKTIANDEAPEHRGVGRALQFKMVSASPILADSFDGASDFPPLFSLVICADDVVGVVAGPQWAKAAEIITLLAPVGALQTATTPVIGSCGREGKRTALFGGRSSAQQLAFSVSYWSPLGSHQRSRRPGGGEPHPFPAGIRLRDQRHDDSADRFRKGHASLLRAGNSCHRRGLDSQSLYRRRLASDRSVSCDRRDHRFDHD
jgi:hypothetical protein